MINFIEKNWRLFIPIIVFGGCLIGAIICFVSDVQSDNVFGASVLKASKDKILKSIEFDEEACEVDDGFFKAKCTKTGKKMVSYVYISDEDVPIKERNGVMENISKREHNKIVFPSENGKEVWRLYPDYTFYKTDNGWKKPKVDVVSKQDFDDAMKLTLIDKIKEFFGKPAYATKYYSGGGDGSVGMEGTGWAAVHDALTGNRLTTASVNGIAYNGGADYWAVDRGGLPIDTSSIPDDFTLTDGSLQLYCEAVYTNNDQTVTVVLETQANAELLAVEDYDQFGTTKGTDVDLDATVSQYNEIVLNATGRGWVNKTGYTKFGIRQVSNDIDNQSPGSANSGGAVFSSSFDAGQEPYFEATVGGGSQVIMILE